MPDGDAAPPRPELPDIPGYVLLEKVGEGGMGQVYRATQRSLRRTVAVKVLDPTPPGQVPNQTFQCESLMASLAHPNVVTVYDCGRAGDRPYLVLEFVAGVDLRPLLHAGQPWPAAKAAPLLDAVAGALAYIHDRSILHLDLKPENVLFDVGGEVKITDFGLAVRRGDARALPDSRVARGTIDYCAPEQRYGLPLDQRSDLFSLATLAYELLTGRLPGRVYVPAARVHRGLPAAVDDVLRRGLARDPDERQRSVAAFRRELGEAFKARPAVRRKTVLLTALAALVALLLALLWLRFGTPGATHLP